MRRRKKYPPGVVPGDDLREFRAKNQNDVLPNVNRLYLWTKKGAFLHAKSLNTDVALEVYDNIPRPTTGGLLCISLFFCTSPISYVSQQSFVCMVIILELLTIINSFSSTNNDIIRIYSNKERTLSSF